MNGSDPTMPSREEITDLLRDNLLAGIDFGEGSTDTVQIETRKTDNDPWEPYARAGQNVFSPNEALTILVSLYEEGYCLRAQMTAHMSGDWDNDTGPETIPASVV